MQYANSARRPCFVTMYHIVTLVFMCIFVVARTDNGMQLWNITSAAKSASQILMVFGGESGQQGEASV